jgi:hypothetical protein
LTISIPPISQRLVDDQSCANYIWYEKFKALQTLEDTKANVTRTINSQTGTTYTFALTDAGDICLFNNALAITVTVPPNSSVAFPIGTTIEVAQTGAGKVTFAQGGGVTIFSVAGNKALSAQYGGGTFTKINTNEWLLVGHPGLIA